MILRVRLCAPTSAPTLLTPPCLPVSKGQLLNNTTSFPQKPRVYQHILDRSWFASLNSSIFGCWFWLFRFVSFFHFDSRVGCYVLFLCWLLLAVLFRFAFCIFRLSSYFGGYYNLSAILMALFRSYQWDFMGFLLLVWVSPGHLR